MMEMDDLSDLSEVIETAISTAMTSCKANITQQPSPKTRKTGGKTGADTGDTIVKVLNALQPMLVAIISAAVKASHTALMEDMKNKNTHTNTSPHESDVLMRNKFEIDKLEQYSRRDNMRIVGIPTVAEEDPVEVVSKLGHDLGVIIRKEDISTAHRVRSRGKRGDPILVRFVRREKKQELMRKKKVLREQKKEIFLEEDLTRMRAAMFFELRRDEAVHSAWTYDGTIYCKTSPTQMKGTAVDTPDDLFKLGWSEDRMAGFFQKIMASDSRTN